MNGTTITGLVILIITLTIHFSVLNRNRAYKKEHNVKRGPLLKLVIITGLLNLVGLIIMIVGMMH
ncbi:hypothetical protein [Companilactobacillus ginsenosidimutans]|uniref:Uncharacterized protein n=1 Tax=Companilactobacillus ginsenosidimutans TaxID=1007676 RepID=A0A0H4QFD1_9LACO|nr:hypothetical protein [Companilactobacillus ginsenosidimutans]AKP67109.1 hypothetical protein ABM34_05860 [Companilactobacillus ginsenosidimutans]